MRIRTANISAKRSRTRLGLLLFATMWAILAPGCAPAGPLVELEDGKGENVAVSVEIVSTPELLQRGLMWRTELPADHGMLFVFGEDAPRSFWMKNTPLPLDIIFINSKLRVVSIAENTVPYSLAQIRSAGPAKFVLEVNAGFSRRHGVTARSLVTLPSVVSPPVIGGGKNG